MFEFESKGNIDTMLELERELLEYLGFGKPIEVKYDEVCDEYGGVPILENEHETRMWEEKGHNISLQYFPRRTNPFWNMKHNNGEIFNKVDVILFGQETIGSAERSCDVDKMREMFYKIEDGKYCEKLFELFGKERVEKELEEFLLNDFFPRFGGGIGMTRLARAYEYLTK
jgi:hypothetical protein